MTSNFSDVGTNLSNLQVDSQSLGFNEAIFASSKSVGNSSRNSTSSPQNKDLLSDLNRKRTVYRNSTNNLKGN